MRRPSSNLRLLVPLTLSAVAVGHAPSAAPATASTKPVADAYVYVSQPAANFGSNSALRTDASPVMRSFLRFNVAGRSGANRVVLRVFAETANAQGLDVRTVVDNDWAEAGLNYNNQPAIGPIVASSGPVAAGSWVAFDVTSAVAGDGAVSFALTSESATAIRFSSREGTNAPELALESNPTPSPYLVTRNGDTYTAQSQSAGTSFSGTLKGVVESAVVDLERFGGGEVRFAAGSFEFGADYFKFDGVNDITFTGAGMGSTVLANVSSADADTEPFNFEASDRITIRDLTVSAGGPLRTTSDALDFDGGDDILIERVEVTAARGRGIVFDGKDAPDVTGGTALRNVVRDCVISGGVLKAGIELLAAGESRIEGCTIRDVGGHGIHMNKAAAGAAQPNKPSTDNVVVGNTITNAGIDGVNVSSGHRNRIIGNTITNSSDDLTGRGGIWIASAESLACDANVVEGNQATDTQPTKTQRYGLAIASPQCAGNVVGDNDFAGNISIGLLDLGTGTVFTDTSAPTAPGSLQASVGTGGVTLTWSAATDNYGVAGHRIRRNGAQIASVDGPTVTFTDSTVAPGTSYTYAVVATDKAGNESADSNSVTVISAGGPASTTIGAAADAYVYSLQPGVTFGTATALRTDSSPIMRSFLRFNVQGRAGAARLLMRVYAETGNTLGIDVRSVAPSSWTETGLTFENQPLPGSTIASSGPVTAGSWIVFDVTAAVAGDGDVTLALTSESSTAVRLSSREGLNPPQLVLSAS